MKNADFNILVIEDDPLVLSGTVRILQKAGYTITKAVTGAEALRTARTNPPDLMLLDVVLPDINGFEVCRQLRADEATRGIFIAIVSGQKISPEDQAQGLDLGADEYITRPIGNRELLARVKALLEACANRHDGLLLESKPGSIALHYRQRPDLAALERHERRSNFVRSCRCRDQREEE